MSRVDKIVEIIEEARREAERTNEWQSVTLVNIDDYKLLLNITPGGKNLTLILQAPKPTNRFVIRNTEVARTVTEVLQRFIADRELTAAVDKVLEKYGYVARKKPRKKYYVIE